MYRVSNAEVAPAMAPRTRTDDFETAASKRLHGYVIGGSAIKDEKRFNFFHGSTRAAEVPHAGEVAFAFLAHIRDQKNTIPECPGEIGVRYRFYGLCNREQGGKAGAVIGHAGPAQVPVPIDRNIIFQTG